MKGKWLCKEAEEKLRVHLSDSELEIYFPIGIK